MGWMQEGSLLADVFERLQGNGRGQTPPACVQSLGKLALSAEDLQAIHVPLVIVVGSQDPVLPLFVEPLRKARPDLPVIDVNGANHSTLPFRPEFKRAILDALKAAPSAQ
jgi:pimeloyl-ACP methyl ester carboxylesterase